MEGSLFISARMQRLSHDCSCKAVADLCDEFEIQVGRGKNQIVEDQTESMVAPTDLYNFYKLLTHDLEGRNPVKDYKRRVQNLSDEAQLIKLSTDAGFCQTAALGEFFMTMDAEEFFVGGN